jgi:hypothetical protein
MSDNPLNEILATLQRLETGHQTAHRSYGADGSAAEPAHDADGHPVLRVDNT